MSQFLIKTLGDASSNSFIDMHFDGTYIYAIGEDYNSGDDSWGASIVKYDIGLNVIAQKTLGAATGDGGDSFYAICSDGTYLYVVGYTDSQGPGGADDCLIVKYDTDLVVQAQATIGGSSIDRFYGVCSVGSNIYAVGERRSGTTIDGFIVKYDTDLIVVTQAYLNPDFNNDLKFLSVCTDGTHIYAVGHSEHWLEGQGIRDASIVKYDTSLTIVSQKMLGGSDADEFLSVYCDGAYIYAVGRTLSEGEGLWDALIVKYDTSLNAISQKILGGANYDEYHSVYSDGTNIYAVGYGNTGGSYHAIMARFDTSLNIIAQEKLWGASTDGFFGVCGDGNYVFMVGYTNSERQGGVGGSDAMIGIFLTGLAGGTYESESGNTTLEPDSLSSAVSTLTSVTSTMTPGVTTFSTAVATLIEETTSLIPALMMAGPLDAPTGLTATCVRMDVPIVPS
ncbi:hypothetical protein KAR91_43155, partial [Candidatus Pacearchaeota archaeon]|nr:hypothetical protein [Candidatus Pacearchaeota archaeon]